MNKKGIWVSESECRDLIWELNNFADRLQADSEYYKKKACELRKRFRQNKQ